MKQKFFVLSMDAMVHEDVAYMETKPNFKKIMEKLGMLKLTLANLNLFHMLLNMKLKQHLIVLVIQ